MSLRLETLAPDPDYDTDAHADAIEVLGADNYTFKIWGGDWCGDCQDQLPQFGAALDAAGVPDDRIEQYPVETVDDGRKVGPQVAEYDIERIPTVVVEQEGVERARFVETAGQPITEYLADALADVEASA